VRARRGAVHQSGCISSRTPADALFAFGDSFTYALHPWYYAVLPMRCAARFECTMRRICIVYRDVYISMKLCCAMSGHAPLHYGVHVKRHGHGIM